MDVSKLIMSQDPFTNSKIMCTCTCISHINHS